MAEVWFENNEYSILCFKHAVKEVIENNSSVKSFSIEQDTNDYSGYLPVCQKCLKEYEEKIEED